MAHLRRCARNFLLRESRAASSLGRLAVITCRGGERIADVNRDTVGKFPGAVSIRSRRGFNRVDDEFGEFSMNGSQTKKEEKGGEREKASRYFRHRHRPKKEGEKKREKKKEK